MDMSCSRPFLSRQFPFLGGNYIGTMYQRSLYQLRIKYFPCHLSSQFSNLQATTIQTMTTQSNYRPGKKKMMMKESEFNDGDRISKLPEDLLHHIFSFLDMKFVIQTSILSRRWRYFWISQPIMNFDQEVYHPGYHIKKRTKKAVSEAKHESCMDFVQRALSLHGASKIHTFRLSCRNSGDFWNDLPLDDWMSILDQCNVEVIDILLNMSDALEPRTALSLPESFFRCRSLTTLKLDLGPKKIYDHSTKLPDCGSRLPLPSLKTVQLRSFRVSKDFLDFLSKCPVLETLVFSKCDLGSHTLKRVKRIYRSYTITSDTTTDFVSREVDIQYSQLKNLVIETNDLHHIRVIAPNLEYFRGRSECFLDYHFENIKSLVKADIDRDLPSYYYCANVAPIYSPKVMECLRGLCNVRSLTLSAWVLELAIEFLDGLGGLPMKPFCYLRLLTLKTSLCKGHVRATTYLLEKCQNLETLVVKMTMPPPRYKCLCQEPLFLGDLDFEYKKCAGKVKSNLEEEKECWEAELAPGCKMEHLKVVEIWDVEATMNTLEFVKFLLKNVVVLEKLIVYISKRQSPSNHMQLIGFGERLKTLPGVSSRIKIVIL